MIRLVCPTNPAHGALLAVVRGWYCPHVAHDGRRGQSRTQAFFTTIEVETASRTPRAAAQSEGSAPSPEPPVPSAGPLAARVPTGASQPAREEAAHPASPERALSLGL